MSATGTAVTLYNQDSGSVAETFTTPQVPTSIGGGESFTPSQSAEVLQIIFRLAGSSDIRGTASCQIYTAAGTGLGTVIGSDSPIAQSDSIDLTTLPVIDTNPSGGLITFNFSTPIVLQSGIEYVAVIRAAVTTGHLTQFACTNNCDPLNNGVFLAGLGGTSSGLWSSFSGIDFNMIVYGFIPTGTAMLTVNTVLVPVKVTVANPTLGFNQTQTTVFGRGGNLVTFTVPVGDGYTIGLDYTDCAGDRQILSSPLFSVLINTTISASGSLPGFFLVRPAPSLTADIDLVKWKVRPDFHHFSISKDGPVDTIFVLVGNQGSETDCFTLSFLFNLPDGSHITFFGLTSFANLLQDATDFATIVPGQEREIAFPFTPTMLGDYSVDVIALWDVALPFPRFASSLKSIKFSVVP